MRGFAVAHMLTAIKEDLAALGVHYDVFTSEAEVLRRGVTDAAISKLEQQGLLYEGVLEPPKASCRKIGKSVSSFCSVPLSLGMM